MLKKNPAERITAAEALEHPYFCEAEDIDEENVDVVPELIKCAPGESPITLSSNPLRKQEKIKKDSCLELKLGKENVFTGKVDTLTETGSTNNSVGKRFESFLSPKTSKFNSKK
jgi:serine/threonine protein kinase